jgi:hypothetical protein
MLTVSTTPLKPSPALQRALAGVKLEALKGIVARGLTRGTLLMAAQIQAKRLTGKGPFPVSQHKLGVVSGRLRQSIRPTAARIEGDSVISSIGSVVSYLKAHEFGFSGAVKVRAHEVTMTSLFGKKLAEPLRFSRLASTRQVKIPERRPIRTGIEENAPLLNREITRELKSHFSGS